MRFSARRRAFSRLGAVLALSIGAYVALLFAPAPLFRYAYAGMAVTLHSDAPLPPEAADVVRRVEAKLQRSPLLEAPIKHDVYLCNSGWRWWLLSGGNHRSAAIALLAPFGRGVITREAHLIGDRLVQASGAEAPDERTLDYYVAHEIAHTMTADFLGARAYLALPVWVREGYADYVGRASDFDYEDARAALVGGIRRRLHPQSGAYLRDVLLVAHLLDREGWPVQAMLRAPPDEKSVEERVRAGHFDRFQPTH
jgi:hypothetical protein